MVCGQRYAKPVLGVVKCQVGQDLWRVGQSITLVISSLKFRNRYPGRVGIQAEAASYVVGDGDFRAPMLRLAGIGLGKIGITVTGDNLITEVM
jgi:hypothetical protein